MKWLKIIVPSIAISILAVSCATNSHYSNDRVYRAPDGTIYKRGDVYRDRNGNAYKNGQIIVYRINQNLPPGQMKKIYGDQSAKKYAHGHRKKEFQNEGYRKDSKEYKKKNHKKHDDD